MSSYLNLCYGDPLFANNPSLGASAGGGGGAGKECRYLHFQVQPARELQTIKPKGSHEGRVPASVRKAILGDSGDARQPSRALERQVQGVKQWINCDLRSFDYSVLGT